MANVEEDVVIDVSHICCKAGYRYLLHDVTWQVRAGEHWVVFGMNGSGKTTLLSIIAGFKHYTAGELKLFGEAPNANNILRLRQRIGWVSSAFFDQYYTKESVLDIVLSAKSGTLGLDGSQSLNDRKLAQDLLTALNLSERMHYTFDMLSKGERQNVLIARALFTKPDILVLDEPCTGLDIYNRAYLFQTLKEMAGSKNTTIIYVTHYAEEITSVFDNCLLLKNGRVFAQGKTQTLFQNELLSQLLDHPVVITNGQDGMMALQVQDVKPDIVAFMA